LHKLLDNTNFQIGRTLFVTLRNLNPLRPLFSNLHKKSRNRRVIVRRVEGRVICKFIALHAETAFNYALIAEGRYFICTFISEFA